MREKIFTNCFLVKIDKSGNPTEVCLGMKKRGFGEGMWNGAGGKPEDSETLETAALREVEEEFGVKAAKLVKRGEILFVLKREEKVVLMHTFLASEWSGEPIETEEMQPKWFRIDEVPYDNMWASDRQWLPIILSGKKIKAKYTYAHEGGYVISREIREVEQFNI